MGIINRKWKHVLSNGSEIEVENYLQWFRTGEVIRVDGVEVYHRSANIFHDLVFDIWHPFRDEGTLDHDFIVERNNESFYINVRMGGHLCFFLRCHIRVNCNLVGGDAEKAFHPIPQVVGGLFYAFVFIILVELIHTGVISSRAISNRLKLEKRVESSSPELWNRDLFRYLDRLKDKKYEEELFNQWKKECSLSNDHHCRLLSYMYRRKKSHDEYLKLNRSGCDQNLVRSCYAIWVDTDVARVSVEYKKMQEKLLSLCHRDKLRSDEIQACINFANDYIKNSGNKDKFRSLLDSLCKKDVKWACGRLKVLDERGF